MIKKKNSSPTIQRIMKRDGGGGGGDGCDEDNERFDAVTKLLSSKLFSEKFFFLHSFLLVFLFCLNLYLDSEREREREREREGEEVYNRQHRSVFITLMKKKIVFLFS